MRSFGISFGHSCSGAPSVTCWPLRWTRTCTGSPTLFSPTSLRRSVIEVIGVPLSCSTTSPGLMPMVWAAVLPKVFWT
ncbi:MAG: hypothetical protein H0W83_01795 [Planctomycetes bacterium]|nr:hypothetical protein [Planctomycetota bacterium]